MKKIFIDGSAGTTGLQIHERLKKRKDILLLKLDESQRKNNDSRKKIFNESDIVFFCLPDAAAIEAANLLENPNTVIIDTSTAHRTCENWTYGLPELKNQRDLIKNSKRIANPGCHATGFIALIAPLIENNIIDSEIKLSSFSITGYSGGGKKMIAEYENSERDNLLDAPRQYALTQNHKHLPEIKKFCGLKNDPIFCPIVSDYYSGMEVTIPIHKSDLKNGDVNLIKEIYKSYYQNGLIKFSDDNENGFLSAGKLSGRDDMLINVTGNDDRILLISRFDNLGKGASGAAVQNMNLVIGINEFESLNY